MATYLSANASQGLTARNVYAGAQYSFGVYNANGNTLSVSDVIQMVAVPVGAVIIDLQVSGLVPGVTATVLKVGDGLSDARFGTVTLSATAQFLRTNTALGHGYQITLSDDAAVRYDTIDLVVNSSASVTTTCSIAVSVVYYMAPR